MLPKRDQYWPTAMQNLITDRIDSPFIWGTNDCCLFAADIIKAMTGADIASEWRGAYSSEADLSNLLTSRGFDSFPALIDSIVLTWNIPSIALRFAQRGDAIMFESSLGPTLGILADYRVVSIGLDGITFIPLTKIYSDATAKAWRI